MNLGSSIFLKNDEYHLINTLKPAYEITINKQGTDFCGLKLTWNHDKYFVDTSMPKYFIKTLEKLNHEPPATPQHAPHKWFLITYGKQPHNIEEVDESLPFQKKTQRTHKEWYGLFYTMPAL